MQWTASPKWLVLLVVLVTVTGCEPFRAPFERLVSGARPYDEERAVREREAFRSDSDPDAIRWLLGHRIENGMPLADVGIELGSEGEPAYDAPWKNDGGTRYRVTDEFHRWGPDRDGKSYYLAFRDGLLVNFDPRDFRE